MLDQSFSADNFRKIIDLENRKGIYLIGDFYTEIAELDSRLKDIRSNLTGLKRAGLSKAAFLEQRGQYNQQKELLESQKENLLIDKLHALSATVTSKSYAIDIQQDNSITSKPVYKVSHSLEHILTLKQLQYNFRKLYKVKQSTRYSVISHLKNILDDGFPKLIVKTDIKTFYESIPHVALLKKINDDNLLTHLSLKFIQQILNKYLELSGTTTGVPRGIGISPYLTELYMRDVDLKIKSLRNVIYYARYVDDIIVVFTPQIDEVARDYKNEIKRILHDESMVMNEDGDKTKVIDLRDKNQSISYAFDYLGYSFKSGYNSRTHIPLKLSISEAKKVRYEDRLNRAFTLYKKHALSNEKKARKLFIKRLRFLMGNTRLVNNKRNVITGIYYANSLINTVVDLQELDTKFKALANTSGLDAQLTARILTRNSFVNGFDPSNISKFSAMELHQIVKNWSRI